MDNYHTLHFGIEDYFQRANDYHSLASRYLSLIERQRKIKERSLNHILSNLEREYLTRVEDE